MTRRSRRLPRGVLSRRYLKEGESVNLHQPVFELVQVDQVVLVVGVPEARIGPIVSRFRDSQPDGTSEVVTGTPANDPDSESSREPFLAYVELLGRDSLGSLLEQDSIDGPSQPPQGRVRQVSQTSDEQSGLFDVEILIDNPGNVIRPGRIAVAKLVVGKVDAFRLPTSAAITQDDRLYLYSLQPRQTSLNLLFWRLQEEAPELVANRYPLLPGAFVEQGDELVLLDLPEEHRLAVVRGQHRLLPGARARVSHAIASPEQLDRTPDADTLDPPR